MKITYIITRMDEIGGAQTHLRDLALWMKNHGHDVTILTGALGKITDQLEAEQIPCVLVSTMHRDIRPLYDITCVWNLFMWLRRLKPDVVACHSSKAGILGRLAAFLAKIPSVFTIHGWSFTEGVPAKTAKLYRVLETLMAKLTSHMIAVSTYDKEIALQHKVERAGKITVIHNGIKNIQAPSPSKIVKKPVRFLMVARFGAQKDHALLLETLSNCLDLDWTLDLLGGGDSTQHKIFCQENDMADRVRFHGQQLQSEKYYYEADVFMLISRWEGFPISVLEAMRAGLPVIASDVGGVREALVDSQTGYLIPRSSQQVLEEKIRKILTYPDVCLEMGEKGRSLYLAQFQFEKMALKTHDIYAKLSR